MFLISAQNIDCGYSLESLRRYQCNISFDVFFPLYLYNASYLVLEQFSHDMVQLIHVHLTWKYIGENDLCAFNTCSLSPLLVEVHS